MNILRLCYDWRVLTAPAAVGVGVFVFAPSLLAAAVPFLLLAVCPLSMLVMMRTMGAKQRSAEPGATAAPGRLTAVQSELADLHRRRQELTQELDELEASPVRTEMSHRVG